MKRAFLAVAVLALFTPCFLVAQAKPQEAASAKRQAESGRLQRMFENNYEERLILFPYEATYNGDHRYDDRLGNGILTKATAPRFISRNRSSTRSP
jgi:hypothetical protein